jgi:hypothetical protein
MWGNSPLQDIGLGLALGGKRSPGGCGLDSVFCTGMVGSGAVLAMSMICAVFVRGDDVY